MTGDGATTAASDLRLVVQACERVETERSRTSEKRSALDRFESTVQSVDVASAGVRTGGSGTLVTAGNDDTTGRQQVRRAFEAHVQPLSGDANETPDTVHEAIATEFSRDVAVALAADGPSTGLSSHLKRAVLDESSQRRTELTVMARTLDRERESLDEARATLDAVCERLDAHADAELLALDFDALAERHRRLGTHRQELDSLAARRQEHLRGATAIDVSIALSHRTLVDYLYADFSVTFPVLDACASLGAACAAAQRSVRSHLGRWD